VLHAYTRGQGRPLVLVHGFTQSGQAWGELGDALASGYTTIALDAAGHGRSASIQAGLPDGADLMVEAVRDGGTGPAIWLGYSMGGRFALHVALRHPEAVERLVLVSATGGIDDPAERAERRQGDEALAARAEEEGVEPFVRWWLAQPLFSTLPAGAAAIDSRLGGSAAGLASSLRRAGAGTQEPLWGRLGELTMPVLVVAGELDHKYVDLADRLVTTIGTNARTAVISGAGHACHLEQPARFLEVVGPFLAGS
jgi:2-succinyl-6-hydroxy-2,4-cyclohexadiene-1-carboxylate synthase